MTDEVELKFMVPELKPDDPGFWNTTKKCKRCSQFYTEKTNNECWYSYD